MTHHETITLNGKTFHLWYQNLQQRQMAIEEYYRQRHYGVMNEESDKRRYRFNFMRDGTEPNSFGML